MTNDADTIIRLEREFWDSLVSRNPDGAVALLAERALMVSEHGAMQFGHDEYRRMATGGSLVLESYEFRDVSVLFPSPEVAILTYRATQVVGKRDAAESTTEEVVDSSTWVRTGAGWRCAAHTETKVKDVSS